MSARKSKDTGPRVCCRCCKRLRYRVVDGQYVEVPHDCPAERQPEPGAAA